MRVSRLMIGNCSVVPDLDILVDEHLVIVGPNSCGKSTMLRLIDAAVGVPVRRLRMSLRRGLIRDEALPLVVQVTFTALTTDDAAAFPDEIEVSPDGATTLSVRVVGVIAVDDDETLDVTREFVKHDGPSIRLTDRHLIHLPWTLLTANRSAESELVAGRAGAVGHLLRKIELGADRTALDGALAGANVALAATAGVADLRVQVAGALSEVYPQPVIAEHVAIGLSLTQDPTAALDIALTTEAGAPAARLIDQSDGMRSLTVLSLQRLAGGRSAVTAIDEPEVHLHPRFQSRVGRMLSQDDGQRLIATHAPAIVKQFKPTHVLALTASGPRQLSGATVAASPKFFSQWWVDQMIEPLTANAVILAEGTSDEILLRALAEVQGLDLDLAGISIVPIGSANNYTSAYDLFGPNGFAIRVAGLVDEKQSHIPAEALGLPADSSASDLAGHGVFVCAPDLEGVYCTALGSERVADLLIRSGYFRAGRIPSPPTLDALTTMCGTSKAKVMAALAVADGLLISDKIGLAPLQSALEYALATH
jgi:putative ATP-dependent endonuclease of OLD family